MTATLVEAGLGDIVQEVVRDHLCGVRTRVAVIAMSRDENPKATVMVFPDRSAFPALAVKVALTPGAAASVLAEADALRRIERLDPSMVGGTVPRRLQLRQQSGHTVLVSTARPGTPMSIDYHHWRHTGDPQCVEADFRSAGAWLRQLSHLRVPPAPLGGPEADWAARILARWPGDPTARAVVAASATRSARLGTDSLGHVVHGDFWCGNVLRRAGATSGVVDWEHASFGGDPIRDRVRFALSYSLYLDRHTRAGAPVRGHPGLTAGAWGDPLRYAVRGQGWYVELVARFVGAGLSATQRSPRLWRDALVMGLVEIAAVSDHEGFARQHLDLAAELTS